ncbi:MAG: phosphatase PAP2 family protein [Bacteroidota bacterium]
MNPIDYAIIHWYNHFALQSRQFDLFMVILLDATLLKGGVVVGVLWCVWFKRSEGITHTHETVIALLAGALLSMVIAKLFNTFVHFRPRPLDNAALAFQLPYGMKPRDLGDWGTFPSDHAAMFFAFATGFFYVTRRLGILVTLFVTFVICVPRMYAGMHYPSDILFGALIAVLSTVATNSARVKAWLSGHVLPWERTSPGLFYATLFLLTYQMATLFIDVRTMSIHVQDLLIKVLHATL